MKIPWTLLMFVGGLVLLAIPEQFQGQETVGLVLVIVSVATLLFLFALFVLIAWAKTTPPYPTTRRRR